MSAVDAPTPPTRDFVLSTSRAEEEAVGGRTPKEQITAASTPKAELKPKATPKSLRPAKT